MSSPVTPPPDAAVRARIEQWIRPEIRALHAYHVPPAAGLIKLDAMENPYRWPPEVVDAWLETLRTVSLNRYPDPSADEQGRAGHRAPPGADPQCAPNVSVRSIGGADGA